VASASSAAPATAESDDAGVQPGPSGIAPSYGIGPIVTHREVVTTLAGSGLVATLVGLAFDRVERRGGPAIGRRRGLPVLTVCAPSRVPARMRAAA